MTGTGDEGSISWPIKQRELVQFVVDSRKWNDFRMRDDDIVIGTWAKSGTNWMQQIVAQLLFDGPEGVYGQEATLGSTFASRPTRRDAPLR